MVELVDMIQVGSSPIHVITAAVGTDTTSALLWLTCSKYFLFECLCRSDKGHFVSGFPALIRLSSLSSVCFLWFECGQELEI